MWSWITKRFKENREEKKVRRYKCTNTNAQNDGIAHWTHGTSLYSPYPYDKIWITCKNKKLTN